MYIWVVVAGAGTCRILLGCGSLDRGGVIRLSTGFWILMYKWEMRETYLSRPREGGGLSGCLKGFGVSQKEPVGDSLSGLVSYRIVIFPFPAPSITNILSTTAMSFYPLSLFMRDVVIVATTYI